MPTVTYQWETADSIAAHQHERPFTGKAPAWYAIFGGNCPTCKVTPQFEDQQITKEPLGLGVQVFGLSSGERTNRGRA